MTLKNPSSHLRQSSDSLNPEIVEIVQEMYKEKAKEVLARLEKMDTGVRKVIVNALEGTYNATRMNGDEMYRVLEEV